MSTRFSASQAVEIIVPEQPVPIQHYLRQPQRLVNALVDPSRVKHLSAERFRLTMRPLTFMTLSIQPTVDIKVWAEANGTIYLQSQGCEIRGIDYINQRFALKLNGYLSPYQVGSKTGLQGNADLEVQVELPPPLWLTPKPILETAGNGLLKSVLLTIKQRLQHQLLADYYAWASDTEETNAGLIIPQLPQYPLP